MKHSNNQDEEYPPSLTRMSMYGVLQNIAGIELMEDQKNFYL